MGNRRTHVRLRTNGLWEARCRVAGKRHSFYGATASEASEKMRAWLRSPAAVDPARYADATNVATVIWAFCARAKAAKADKTWRSYESIARIHVVPRIGTLDPAKISARHVTAMLDDMERAGVGARTRELAYILVGAAFRVLRPELLDNVAKPVAPAAEMQPWTAAQARQFLQYVEAEKHPHAILYRLALSIGARKGELLALTVDDFDMRAARIAITKSWNDKLKIAGPTKTKSSRRSVSLPDRVARALRAYILATGLRGSERLFPFEPRSLAKIMKRAMRAARVPAIRFHDLRHTFATLALANGVPVKVVSEMLGHQNVRITLDTYAHVLPGMHAAAAEQIDALIG